ncbi:hypothetical protein A3G14_02635 [Candidatus Curtissbacteria bacterium RIFCSPLOWO2_12_FULL_38_9]|uniref:Uncharacterized protein n=1 Tax=Candidatus Curtissbacteria bacterium RIFCSPLOWO2_12_FULL_38_9 TaxID=1797735 RepID=A0A1F5IAF9_9BACT|nr:MAG: hypothetical protein A3G14_02635 [Candidatus Curtissbacteria bacterium RIFCSPLOWO2_12_FULL_38_9]
MLSSQLSPSFFNNLRPLDRAGAVDISQNKVEAQIASAVGRGEVKRFSDLLEAIQYPNVTQYNLDRDRAIPDHDWISISFTTKDNFDSVLEFYKSKFPSNEPYIETRSTSAATGEPIEPFRSAQISTTDQKSGLFLRLDIHEDVTQNSTRVSLTNSD